MAMSGRGRREAENAIASCRPFQNSTGSLKGTRGATRDLGWLGSHEDATRIKQLLNRAVYVVWSYGTPIAWVTETEDGDRQAYYVDEQHSVTTSHHQTIARLGLGEYETIGDRRERERENRRRAAMRRMDVRNTDPQPTGRERPMAPRRSVDAARQAMAVAQSNENLNAWAEAARREPTAAHVYAASARVPADSPGYQNGRTESEQEATLARLLDPRYSNPDWVPGRDIVADLEAERRDIERVAREGGWRP